MKAVNIFCTHGEQVKREVRTLATNIQRAHTHNYLIGSRKHETTCVGLGVFEFVLVIDSQLVTVIHQRYLKQIQRKKKKK
jgi:hypothetical protein